MHQGGTVHNARGSPGHAALPAVAAIVAAAGLTPNAEGKCLQMLIDAKADLYKEDNRKRNAAFMASQFARLKFHTLRHIGLKLAPLLFLF